MLDVQYLASKRSQLPGGQRAGRGGAGHLDISSELSHNLFIAVAHCASTGKTRIGSQSYPSREYGPR